MNWPPFPSLVSLTSKNNTLAQLFVYLQVVEVEDYKLNSDAVRENCQLFQV